MSNYANIHIIEEDEEFVPPPPLMDDDDWWFEPGTDNNTTVSQGIAIIEEEPEDEDRYGKDLSFHAEISEEEMLFGIKEHEFCDICCESWANMTASCGHKYCAFCVIKIIIAEKKNAPQPRCCFCRAPFNKFTTPSIATSVVLTDWAEKSFPTL